MSEFNAQNAYTLESRFLKEEEAHFPSMEWFISRFKLMFGDKS